MEVTIPLSTLNTGVPALDDDFRSTDFFDTSRFPTATFKSTRVVKDAAVNRLKVTGDLTLHGMTKAVILEVTVVKVGITPDQPADRWLRRHDNAETLRFRAGTLRSPGQ